MNRATGAAVTIALGLSLTGCPHPRQDVATPAPPPVAPSANSADAHARRFTMLDEITPEIWPAGPRPAFKPTTAAERDGMRALLPAMMKAAIEGLPEDPAWGAAATAIGFRLEVWELGTQTYWALLEQDGARRGAGAYLVRVGRKTWSGPEVILEAPHVWFDTGTEGIAASLFFLPPTVAPAGVQPRALFTNTVHRYQDSKDPRQRTYDNPADVCHNASHLFNVATVSAAKELASAGGVEVIQLHGYADDDGESHKGLGAGSTMVVSAGREHEATKESTALAHALKHGFDPGVRLYPTESTALGATKNVQGIGVRSIHGAVFLHLEMCFSLRRELNADPSRLKTFGTILLPDGGIASR